jgi:hypothetical protein
MAACGEVKPMPDFAIFADTQAEPASVYKWLDWLETQLPFPVHRVTRGRLSDLSCVVRTSKTGTIYTKHTPPAYITDGAKKGLLMRQCTENLKIGVIYSAIGKMRERGQLVDQWIGISLDEAHRMKPARRSYITNRWPLVDGNITRTDCLNWMRARGYPTPPKSACVFCPYHDDNEWLRLQEDEPEAFRDACAYERNLQAAYARVPSIRGVPYLHKSCVPLDSVQFLRRAVRMKHTQTNMNFGNECLGLCGT